MNSTGLSADTSICVGCGMCCDGTLFAGTSIQLHEEPRLVELGFALETANEGRQFKQPCTKFNCGICTIYEERPAACRSFRCSLLKSFEAGEIGFVEAVEKIATAKALQAAVIADDPEAGRWPYRHDKNVEAFKSGDVQARQNLGPKLLRVGALLKFLNRWFSNKQDA